MMEPKKRIRDPLYGFIGMSEDEVEVIDTPQMQRLKRVRQLGLSDVVYPAATHTRFEHSLGVAHLAGKLTESLSLTEEQRNIVRFAALLHDVGHGPFSHVSERVAQKRGLSHEDISCQIVKDIDPPVDTERVINQIRGESKFNIIAGTIDADRMDYLQRDAYNTGINHGMIDSDTLIKFANIEEDQIVFDGKCIQAIEGFLTSRSHMRKSVYKHHTSTIAEKMLQRGLEDLLDRSELSIKELMRLDDYQATIRMSEQGGTAKKMIDKINSRNLYKRSIVLNLEHITRDELRRLEKINEVDFERKICDTVGLPRGSVLIDTPNIPETGVFDVRIKHYGTIRDLSELSTISTALDIGWTGVSFDVFSPSKHSDKVRQTTKEILNSELSVDI